MNGEEAIKELIRICDQMAIDSAVLEGKAGEPFPADELVRYFQGVREMSQNTATILRFIVQTIESGKSGVTA